MVTETRDIFVVLDEEGFVDGWGTSLVDSRGVYKVTIPVDSPFITGNYTSCYRYKDGSIILDEDKAFETDILWITNSFKKDCEGTYVYARVPYTLEGTTYLFDNITEEEFIGTSILLDNRMKSYVEVPAYDNSGAVAKVFNLDRTSYNGLARYIREVVINREKKLNNKLIPMIKDANSLDEAKAVTWDMIPDDPLPEKEDIIPEDSDENIDILIKENKELKQRVEFNELALMDAINMFSEMNK